MFVIVEIFSFGECKSTTYLALPDIKYSKPQGPLGFLSEDCPSKNKKSEFVSFQALTMAFSILPKQNHLVLNQK